MFALMTSDNLPVKYEIGRGKVGGRTRVRDWGRTWGTKTSHFGYQTSEP